MEELLRLLIVLPGVQSEHHATELPHLRYVLPIVAIHEQLGDLLNGMIKSVAVIQSSEVVQRLHHVLDLRTLPMCPLASSEDLEVSTLNFHHRQQVSLLPHQLLFWRYPVGPPAAWFWLLLFPTVAWESKLLIIFHTLDHVERVIWKRLLLQKLFCSARRTPEKFRTTQRNEASTHRSRIEGSRIEVLNRMIEHELSLFISQLLSTYHLVVQLLHIGVHQAVNLSSPFIRKSAPPSSCSKKHEFSKKSHVLECANIC